ncbi:RecQ family ATP-dependent DNA helicase [Mycoplasmatota bacterium]|nr:RecQ family ATP-dependent DNA helicase [Mycoplasmatota bacterium]
MICFFDIETKNKTNKIVDLAAYKEDKSYIHENNIKKFRKFINKADFFAGHNIMQHDIPILQNQLRGFNFNKDNAIDTLLISVLVFPDKPYHKLIKNDKLKPEDSNNPLNDSKNSFALFKDEHEKFISLDKNLKTIYYTLLRNTPGFSGFFRYIGFEKLANNLSDLIRKIFFDKICENASLDIWVDKYPVELAYTLALITTENVESKFPAWLLINYPMVEQIIKSLRSTPCVENCHYCAHALNANKSLKDFFNYDSFRTYDGEVLQEKAVDLALNNKSMIVVFPTGGGKSVTYQLPALMSGVNSRSLTVVISPLQSLMKDQVDGLEKKTINMSGTINGLLDPIERSKVIERVRDGRISLLYLAPESLRSRTIENLLLERDIARFVIDEAHCFSTWGHDFRVDYLYIGKFIKLLQDKKGNHKQIPISCFTATAKQDVIKDIEDYFNKTLDLNMEKIVTRSARKNLKYKVIGVEDDTEKYKEMRTLINHHDCSTIIYASRTKSIDQLYNRLKQDGYSVSKFHGKMEKDEKVLEQNKFMSGETNIMVATSAFGMGVDKSDVEMVIHYDISNSIENYIQEAGRAGRDQNIQADCYILYNEKDLDKHFRLLSQTKLNQKEIQQVWSGIKNITKTRKSVTKSALEIARSAGWDEEVRDVQTRITTAIATLEDSGYLIRKQNAPRVFADGILVETQIEAAKRIDESKIILDNDKEVAKRITKSLISSKYTKRGVNDQAEARVDYISDNLGIELKEVMRILRLLREEQILADVKDLRCTIKKNLKINSSKIKLDQMVKLERVLLDQFKEDIYNYNLKEINESAQEKEIKSNMNMVKLLINYMDISHIIIVSRRANANISLKLEDRYDIIVEKLNRMHLVSSMIVDYLFNKSFKKNEEVKPLDEENEVSFSIEELKKHVENQMGLMDKEVHSNEIEDCLFYLKKIEALNIEGGFLVIYNPMTIERIQNTSKRYVKADYQKLENFYQNKTQQIHIVGEYATTILQNYDNALNFVNDYFVMEYDEFLRKHFNKRKSEISRNMSKAKFKEIYENLSTDQVTIVKDMENESIVVAAGPGSGKTRLLVHKLASIFYTEDIRHEQLLMLTFSRAAVDEFKERIVKMIGSQAYFFEIKTFHSFCFELLGKMGDIEKSEYIIKEAVELIRNDEVERSRITKMIIVIDEAQDMREEEFELIQLLVEKNENVKLIAVGDDDQNIYSFRGSSNEYLKTLSKRSKVYELTKNYRSKKNIVTFANAFVKSIANRLKQRPIQANQEDNGQISVFQYQYDNLITPLVNQVINTKLKGKTCVLTKTNMEANYIAGLLNKKGYPAQLIQDNNHLVLYNFLEIREFFAILYGENITISSINQSQWEQGLVKLANKYQNTLNYPVFLKALKEFDKISGKLKFSSDFKEFMKTALFDDYIETNQMMVSTLHKAKGREFDNLFILYDNKYINNDEERRLLYVGITRAKKNLFIHYKGDFFKFNQIENFTYQIDENMYDEPEYLVFTLTHKDLNLGYFSFTQDMCKRIELDTKLEFEEKNKFSYQDRKILQFSKAYAQKYIDIINKGYIHLETIVRHKIIWYDSQNEKESIIVLPQITFVKDSNNHIEKEGIKGIKLDKNNEDEIIKIREQMHEYISKHIKENVYAKIKNHKSLKDGKYLVKFISDFYGGTHEGKNYFGITVLHKDKSVQVGCKSIYEVN